MLHRHSCLEIISNEKFLIKVEHKIFTAIVICRVGFLFRFYVLSLIIYNNTLGSIYCLALIAPLCFVFVLIPISYVLPLGLRKHWRPVILSASFRFWCSYSESVITQSWWLPEKQAAPIPVLLWNIMFHHWCWMLLRKTQARYEQIETNMNVFDEFLTCGRVITLIMCWWPFKILMFFCLFFLLLFFSTLLI